MHAVMQYIDFSACSYADKIDTEISRLVAENRITADQASFVDKESILAFFQTPIGKQLQSHSQVLREFKFSVLDRAEKYYPSAEGEQILLQGVVDCALIDTDGITVLDFKTDRVTEETLSAVSTSYRSQVQIYADALSRIYHLPVKAAYLYFFKLNQFVKVD